MGACEPRNSWRLWPENKAWISEVVYVHPSCIHKNLGIKWRKDRGHCLDIFDHSQMLILILSHKKNRKWGAGLARERPNWLQNNWEGGNTAPPFTFPESLIHVGPVIASSTVPLLWPAFPCKTRNQKKKGKENYFLATPHQQALSI